MDADGTHQRRLTHAPTRESVSAWSPDGTRLLYYGNSDGGQDDELFVLELAGMNVLQLTKNEVPDQGGEFSPGGATIVFSRSPGYGIPHDLWLMNADGTGARQITRDAGGEWAPSFSPDGTRIAFTSETFEGGQIAVMALDGEDRMAVDGGPQAITPDW
jgi:TolB protein